MNIRILRTKTALLDALRELLIRQNMREISISELCRRAGVNRTTFYKYYTIPSDILKEQLDLMSLSIWRPDATEKPKMSAYETLLQMCRMYQKNQWLLQIYRMMDRDLISLLQGQMVAQKPHSVETNSVHYFISGGVTVLLLKWLEQGCQQSPEAMAKLMTRYIDLLQPPGSTELEKTEGKEDSPSCPRK